MKTTLLSLAFGLLMVLPAAAGEPCQTPACCTEICGAPDCCGHCGCRCGCQKYCKVVCTTKEVKKYCFVVHCEDFCAPLPGCPRGQDCDDCCQSECKECARCCNGKNCDPCQVEYNKRIVPPKCGKVRTKKTLEKKEIVCKVPTYKCVVVYCCPQCGACMTPSTGEQPAAAPPAAAPKLAPAPAPQAPPAPVEAPKAPQPKSADGFHSMQNLLSFAAAR
jgi:hypothetical protein